MVNYYVGFSDNMEWDNITGGTGSGIRVNGQNGHCALRKETPQICTCMHIDNMIQR